MLKSVNKRRNDMNGAFSWIWSLWSISWGSSGPHTGFLDLSVQPRVTVAWKWAWRAVCHLSVKAKNAFDKVKTMAKWFHHETNRQTAVRQDSIWATSTLHHKFKREKNNGWLKVRLAIVVKSSCLRFLACKMGHNSDDGVMLLKTASSLTLCLIKMWHEKIMMGCSFF